MTLRQDYVSTYECWINMRTRCFNPKYKLFSRYGGRGITIDARWLTFDNFFADMGPKPDGLTLERRDNDGPYSKDNCFWATRKEQSLNRVSSVKATVDGVSKHGSEWCELLGVSRNAFYTRARRDGCEAAVRHYQEHGLGKRKSLD